MMPSPPLMLLCAAGVGLAALLYYYFAAKEERERMSMGYAAPSGGGRQRRRDRYEADECSICQDMIYIFTSSSIRTLPCGHSFHVACIDKWSEASPAYPTTCPNCRQPVYGTTS